MPADPEQCRANAQRCTALANSTEEPQMKQILTDLARQWTRRAIELEQAEAPRDASSPPTQGAT
jgi:hypothetical protein